MLYNLLTSKQKLEIYEELYGRSGPLPPLKQVVPGKFIYRGDFSYIRCRRCGKMLYAYERNHRFGMCDKCQQNMIACVYPPEKDTEHNKRMAKGMVLSNSCNYERWS